MPSETPLLTQDVALDEFASLSDDDVAILYNIVKAAGDFNDLNQQPFNALFSAYDQVLAQNDLNPDHDQVYLRFLTRLGDRSDAGNSLFESFAQLLDEAGIKVEFDSDEEEYAQGSAYGDGDQPGGDEYTDVSVDQGLQHGLRGASSARPDSQQLSRDPAGELLQRKNDKKRRVELRDSDKHGDGVEPVPAVRSSPSDRSASDGSPSSGHGILHLPSNTQLVRDADTFNLDRIRLLTSSFLQTWRKSALVAKSHHQTLADLAQDFDAGILIRQSFSNWRSKARHKRHVAQTKLYFGRLEARAIAARNLYLIDKAFSHWYQSAEEQRLKTAVARRQILSIKYFSAWKDHTILNETKAQAHGTKKILRLWKERLFQTTILSIKGDLARDRLLLKRTYWTWFRAVCEQRAPEWYVQRLRQKYFHLWTNASRSTSKREAGVSSQVETAAKRYFLSNWITKVRDVQSKNALASTYNVRNALASALGLWRRAHTFKPLSQKISNAVDWRIAGETFGTAVYRTRLEQHAENLNYSRRLRNAWTQWNDCLRWQTFNARMDDRCAVQMLYKWTVAERSRLMIRFLADRKAQACLLILRDTWLARRSRRGELSQIVEDQHLKLSLGAKLTHWVSYQRKLAQYDSSADFSWQSTLARKCMASLHRRLEHVHFLESRAKDLNFYFTSKRFLKNWQLKVGEVQRQKRRSAYMTIRRKIKMSLASGILTHWKATAAARSEQTRLATSIRLSRDFKLATKLWDDWKLLYAFNIQQAFEASDFREQSLVAKHLRYWIDRLSQVQGLHRAARLNVELRDQAHALTCLNRFRLRLIELKGPLATAGNLRSRYEKRRFHRLFWTWQEISARRLQRPSEAPTGLKKSMRPSTIKSQRPNVQHTTKEEIDDLANKSTLSAVKPAIRSKFLTGYLSTPSKRAARVRSLAQASTTPSETPFQNRLRDQLNATPQRSTKRLLFSVTPGVGEEESGVDTEGQESDDIGVRLGEE